MVPRKQKLMFMISVSLLLTGYYYTILQSVSQSQVLSVVKELKVDVCEVIHLGIMCITQSSKLNFYPMVKSVLYHRTNPVHFHVVVTDQTKKCLSKLFQTWSVPQVEVSFYDINNISSNNHSKIPNTFRLILSKIIELQEVNRLILLSTSIIFNEDIYELWVEFKRFHKKQVLGFPYRDPKDLHESDADIVLVHLNNLRRFGWISETEYVIPCVWNSKINCLLHEFKVINRNRKEYISTMILSSISNYNGNKVRKINNNCYKELELVQTKKPVTNNMCANFPESEIHLKRTLIYFYKYSYVSSDLDVTLVSQLSFQKLKLLEEFAVRWKGPISFAVYLSDAEYVKCRQFIGNSKILKNRLNIGYHAVFKDAYSHHINYLRNVALSEVNTPYVFLNDIDLIPMQNLYTVIKSYLNSTGDMKKKALVVPAFQAKDIKIKIPTTKNELLSMWDQKKISIFKMITFLRGHLQTNYTKWRNSTKPYEVQWKYEYEPYIVVKSDVIKFDERFFAYGWDKIAHITELKAQNYEFFVLPNAFVVHKYHKITNDKVVFLTLRKFKLCIESIKRQFVEDINKKYLKHFIIR